MNKTEFIKCVSRKSGYPQTTVRDVLNAMTAPNGVIVSCMLRQDRLVFPGFGCFYTSLVKAHDRPHPRTGEPMSVCPCLRMQFKPGEPVRQALKDATPEEDA